MSGISLSSLECRAQRCQELHTFYKKKIIKIMTLLQLSQDSVTVSTLPHPISMFFLGVSFIISLYLFFELSRVRNENRSISKENVEIREKIRQYKIEVDKTVGDLSKKVDSRVDKAIETMKKQLGN
jgi:hypothetical protein